MISIDLKSLVGKLNNPCQTALEGAAGFCLSRQHYNVEIEHWLIKLLEIQDSDLLAILDKFDINPGKFAQELNKELEYLKSGNTRAPALSPSVVELAKSAWMLASIDYQHPLTTSAHLLGAMLLDDSLRRATEATSGELEKITPDSLREVIRSIVGSTSESRDVHLGDTSATQTDSSKSGTPSKTPSLDKFTINLTESARQGKIDAVLGRDEEIRQIIDILIRRRQNNPILTGEAGVGKTAVAEGFALRIASGDVPDQLKNVMLLSLDLGLLQAGASVKGEFENRLKSVISEVKSSPEPIVLFIDEAHTMIGAGGKEGQGDAANLLKPALARGELRTIAATTWAEYKKYFERDAALTRRFQVVKIEEPDEEKAINMMRAISVMLQNHHGVRIMDDAIVDSVKLSARYITARQLPDKSVSLLDTACARVSLSQSATPVSVEDTQRRITQCQTNIKLLERENAILGNCDERIQFLNDELNQLEKRLTEQEAQWDKEKNIVADIHQLQKEIEDDFHQNNTKISGTKEKEPAKKEISPAERKKTKTKLHKLMHTLNDVQGECPMIQINVGSQAIAEV
ncbi:ClpB-like protein, partial [hydrothermal vent metagenome]